MPRHAYTLKRLHLCATPLYVRPSRKAAPQSIPTEDVRNPSSEVRPTGPPDHPCGHLVLVAVQWVAVAFLYGGLEHNTCEEGLHCRRWFGNNGWTHAQEDGGSPVMPSHISTLGGYQETVRVAEWPHLCHQSKAGIPPATTHHVVGLTLPHSNIITATHGTNLRQIWSNIFLPSYRNNHIIVNTRTGAVGENEKPARRRQTTRQHKRTHRYHRSSTLPTVHLFPMELDGRRKIVRCRPRYTSSARGHCKSMPSIKFLISTFQVVDHCGTPSTDFGRVAFHAHTCVAAIHLCVCAFGCACARVSWT